jgi:Kdo2-lipid IVA lauroyltransferase/acyltransferase
MDGQTACELQWTFDAKSGPEPAMLRLISRLPTRVLYAVATLTYWLAFRVGRLRVDVARENIDRCFPELDDQARAQLLDTYHRHIADMAWEVVKAFSITPEELAERMAISGLEPVAARLAGGQPVMLLTSHHCNWEWLLLRLANMLPYPIEAMYKPLHNRWAQRGALKLRTRFGTRLIPAKLMVPEMIKHRDQVRALCMVADQVPQTSPYRYWTRFLGRDTAFYMGAEEISRAARYPVYFVAIERLRRGYYAATVRLLAEPGDGFETPKEITRRYVEALEAHLRAHPADWLWSHKRWKLKKSLYAR